MEQVATPRALGTDADNAVLRRHARSEAGLAAFHSTFTAAVCTFASGPSSDIEAGARQRFSASIDLCDPSCRQHCVTSRVIVRHPAKSRTKRKGAFVFRPTCTSELGRTSGAGRRKGDYIPSILGHDARSPSLLRREDRPQGRELMRDIRKLRQQFILRTPFSKAGFRQGAQECLLRWSFRGTRIIAAAHFEGIAKGSASICFNEHGVLSTMTQVLEARAVRIDIEIPPRVTMLVLLDRDDLSHVHESAQEAGRHSLF